MSSRQQWQEIATPAVPGDISICFVHFPTLTLTHLDAALYSLAQQDLTGVNGFWYLDNNSPDPAQAQLDVLARYPALMKLTHMVIDKHGRSDRTHSWSVNTICQRAPGPWIFFARSDYILDFSALARMRDEVLRRPSWDQKRFVSGWCWQMAYDREARNIDAPVDIEQYNWRTIGLPALLQHPYGFKFHETDQDAGVWFTNRAYMADAGWMNEGLVSWGYQQSTFQRALTHVARVTCSTIPDYLFAHQHHYAVRDFAKARAEYDAHGGGM